MAVEILVRHHESQPIGDVFTVAVAQLGGPWLDGPARLARVVEAAGVAASAGAELVAFPETYLSGYPFWLPRTGGASFDHPDQKACYAYYLNSAITASGPQLRELETAAADLGIAMVVGASERGIGPGAGTVWCTLLTIDPRRGMVGHHRKLVPTYDERLVWAHGDGAGLRCHSHGAATVGSLNCWENWMPQARSALYGQGESVHIGCWPGSAALTSGVTRFVAAEGRVFSVASSGLVTADSIPPDFPLAVALRSASDEVIFDGGSAVAGPDGRWLIEPVTGVEGLLLAELDLGRVAQERLTFDPTGHYARPDVFQTVVDRRRRPPVYFLDDEPLGETS
jgi:nitrilase